MSDEIDKLYAEYGRIVISLNALNERAFMIKQSIAKLSGNGGSDSDKKTEPKPEQK
jgi:hypothetical protein